MYRPTAKSFYAQRTSCFSSFSYKKTVFIQLLFPGLCVFFSFYLIFTLLTDSNRSDLCTNHICDDSCWAVCLRCQCQCQTLCEHYVKMLIRQHLQGLQGADYAVSWLISLMFFVFYKILTLIGAFFIYIQCLSSFWKQVLRTFLKKSNFLFKKDRPASSVYVFKFEISAGTTEWKSLE